jgi:hypothetical protein
MWDQSDGLSLMGINYKGSQGQAEGRSATVRRRRKKEEYRLYPVS